MKSATRNVQLLFVLGLACIAPTAGCHDPPRQDPAADSATDSAVAVAPPPSASAPPPVAAADDAAVPADPPSANVDDAGAELTTGARRAAGRAPRGAQKGVTASAASSVAEPVAAAPSPDPSGTEAKRTKRVLAPMVNDTPYGTAATPSVAPTGVKKEPMRDEDPYAKGGSGKN